MATKRDGRLGLRVVNAGLREAGAVWSSTNVSLPAGALPTMRAILITAVSLVLIVIIALGSHFGLTIAAAGDGDLAKAANDMCVTCHGG